MSPKAKKKRTISVVIPFFDEEKNIGKLIKFLINLKIFNEIICVNDGSTDKSINILKEFKNNIKIISFKKNYGKGHALASGIKKSKGEIVVFLDADLINLTEKHIKKLTVPMLKGKTRAVIGYGTPKKNHFFCSHPLVQMVTGQRAYFREDLLPYLNPVSKTRYGVEIYLSNLFPQEQTLSIPLVKLTHIWKHKKHNPQKAIKQYIQLGTEVVTEFGKQKITNNIAWKKISETTEIQMLKQLGEEIKDLSDDLMNLRNPKKTFRKIKHYYDKIISLYKFD